MGRQRQQLGDPLGERRQCWGVAFGVVDVVSRRRWSSGCAAARDRRSGRAAVLDRHAQRLGEGHRIEDVPAVAGVENAALLAPFFRVVVQRHAVIRIREGVLEIPGPAEIVFAAGAFDRGLLRRRRRRTCRFLRPTSRRYWP